MAPTVLTVPVEEALAGYQPASSQLENAYPYPLRALTSAITIQLLKKLRKLGDNILRSYSSTISSMNLFASSIEASISFMSDVISASTEISSSRKDAIACCVKIMF